MTKLIPRELLFGNPERTAPQISPDGTKLAFVAPVDGVLNVWVSKIGEKDARPITSSKDRPVRSYSWTHDGRHLLYLQDKGGNENFHCYLVDIDGGDERDLTPFDAVQVRMLATSPRVPNRVLLGINRDNPQLHDAYSVDLTTGELTLVAKNPGFGTLVGNWLVDSDLRPRAGLKQTAEGGWEIHYRDTEDDEWRVIYTVSGEDYLNARIVGFNGDGKGIYLSDAKGSDTCQLLELDVVTGETQVIASDDKYDWHSVRLHPTTKQVQIAGYFKDRLELLAIDPQVSADLDKLSRHDPGDLIVLNGDDADRTWLVAYVHDNAATVYCAYKRDKGEIMELFKDRPALDEYELASTASYSFTARDGLTIHGYMTFPPGSKRRDLPTVLMVHGGPWSRDLWGFNPQAQWLANRGYLCLQVDFRGSTGYGKEFVNAADHEWAGKMHDDLLDAVEFVGGQGYCDRSRVAIYGGSYGGYAALVGATFTPDFFKCAVDKVGPSNLITLLNNIPPYWKPWENVWHTRVGHPERDREELWSRSPLSRVDQIKIPMLVAQGANDPRVTRVEAEQIVDAMKERGIPHKYLLFEDEGHGFAKPENNLKYCKEVEEFLAEHLGGRFEP